MTKRLQCLAGFIAGVLALACLAGCPSPPTGAPDASTSQAVPPEDTVSPEPGHKLGVSVNEIFSIGTTVAEMPVAAWKKLGADDGGPGNQAETPVGVIGPGPTNIPIGAVQFTPNAALTASNTAEAVISVYKRNTPDGGGGTNQTLIASIGTATTNDGGSGNWCPYIIVPHKVVAGAFVSPGDTITVAITKVSTGTVVPAGQLAIFNTVQ